MPAVSTSDTKSRAEWRSERQWSLGRRVRDASHPQISGHHPGRSPSPNPLPRPAWCWFVSEGRAGASAPARGAAARRRARAAAPARRTEPEKTHPPAPRRRRADRAATRRSFPRAAAAAPPRGVSIPTMSDANSWIQGFSGNLLAGLIVAAIAGVAALLGAVRRLQVLRQLVLQRYDEYSAAHEDAEERKALVRLEAAVEDFGHAALWYPLPSRGVYRNIHRRLELELQRKASLGKLLSPIRDLRDGRVDPLRGASPDELKAKRARLDRFEHRWRYVIAAIAVLLPLLIAVLVAINAA